MDFDLSEIVQLDGKPVSLFAAVRKIMQLPAVKRFPGLAIFREAGKQPALFELSQVEEIALTPEFKAALARGEP
jgi:hypothetical protein